MAGLGFGLKGEGTSRVNGSVTPFAMKMALEAGGRYRLAEKIGDASDAPHLL